jgi:hypothetical protein
MLRVSLPGYDPGADKQLVHGVSDVRKAEAAELSAFIEAVGLKDRSLILSSAYSRSFWISKYLQYPRRGGMSSIPCRCEPPYSLPVGDSGGMQNACPRIRTCVRCGMLQVLHDVSRCPSAIIGDVTTQQFRPHIFLRQCIVFVSGQAAVVTELPLMRH